MKHWSVYTGSDLWISLILMIFSGYVIHGALDLGVGTPREPGSGFMFLGTATLLGLLAIALFFRATLGRRQAAGSAERTHGWRILVVVAANFAYIFLMTPVGYVLCTFAFLFLLFQIYEKGSWIGAVAWSAATSVLSYLLFSTLLQVNLPQGLLRLG